jgi:hypothetical protein
LTSRKGVLGLEKEPHTAKEHLKQIFAVRKSDWKSKECGLEAGRKLSLKPDLFRLQSWLPATSRWAGDPMCRMGQCVELDEKSIW